MTYKLTVEVEPFRANDALLEVRIQFLDRAACKKFHEVQMVPITSLRHQSFLELLFETALRRMKQRMEEEEA